jgi:hypothetical protein
MSSLVNFGLTWCTIYANIMPTLLLVGAVSSGVVAAWDFAKRYHFKRMIQKRLAKQTTLTTTPPMPDSPNTLIPKSFEKDVRNWTPTVPEEPHSPKTPQGSDTSGVAADQ